MQKKVEPDTTLCFDDFEQKQRQGEDHDSTGEEER